MIFPSDAVPSESIGKSPHECPKKNYVRQHIHHFISYMLLLGQEHREVMQTIRQDVTKKFSAAVHTYMVL